MRWTLLMLFILFAVAQAHRSRRHCVCAQQRPLRCACSPTQSQQACGCAPYSPCGCSSSVSSCSAPCEEQCINSCLSSSPLRLCQITCQQTCKVACSNKQLYNSAKSSSISSSTPVTIVVNPVPGQKCSGDCNAKCVSACLSLQYSSSQCSDSCHSSCGSICDQRFRTSPADKVVADVSREIPQSCAFKCEEACQSSCLPTISPTECRNTCKSTCTGLCPRSSTIAPPTLVNLDSVTYHSTTITAEPQPQVTAAPDNQKRAETQLKINIKLLPSADLSPQHLSSPTPSPFIQCLRQCDIGCQQSCRARIPLPDEGCDASCVSTCDHVCAPSEPSQMISKDVSTYPVRLDPQQRCISECQSVCHLACTTRSPSDQCIDSCNPKCDEACSSTRVQKNSAELFQKNVTHSPSLVGTAAPSFSNSGASTPTSLNIKTLLEPRTVKTLHFSKQNTDCSKTCEAACTRQCLSVSDGFCTIACKSHCYKEICLS